MGEVFRARDTRLDRDVAIKVLPEAMAHDAERVLRFEREAKLLAALSHSNIAAIYGFEESNGQRFLVLEYVEGETLASRLRRGRLPVDDGLEICKHIAEALEAAHDKGIVHRDLKPGNVMIKPDGTVKVLDFGLARAMGEDSGSSAARVDSPTITADYTKPGVVLGTAPYMSPEQARGRPVDKRSDIWSFGVIVYECLTGEVLFRGETATDSLGAIMHREPQWVKLPSNTPPTVQLLLHRCLTKDRDKRLHDIADARIEIENALADPTSSSLRLSSAIAEGSRPRPAAWRRTATWVICLIIMAALAAGWLRPRGGSSPAEGRVLRLSIPAPKAIAIFNSMAISPNGRFVVYETESARASARLHLRAFDKFEDRPLGSNENAFAPFVSSDSSEVGFFTDQDIRVVSTSGGSERRVCDAFGYVSGAWGPNNTIIFSTARVGPDARPGLSRVQATGGVPEVLTSVDPKKNERAHVTPETLPDGKHVLFCLQTDTTRQIAVLSLETLTYKVILDDAGQPHYSNSGHLVFHHNNSKKVFAVPFDPVTLQVTGQRVVLTDDITTQAVISRNGMLAYLPVAKGEGSTVVSVDHQGNETALPVRPGSWVQPRISPDGSKLVLRQTQAPDCFLWMFELDRSTLTRLTFNGDSHAPVWDSDGQHVFAGIESNAMRSLHKLPVDGSSPPVRLWSGKGPDQPGRVSSDGGLLPFVEQNTENNTDIWVLSLKGEVKAAPYLQTPFREDLPAFSTDGKFIAYCCDESGREEVYVRPYPGPGAKTLVSTEGGTGPLWSRDGKELFYAQGNAMMAADISTEPVFHASTPKKLFEGSYDWDRSCNYDVSPDGKRFVMIKPAGGDMQTREMRVIVNWFEALKAGAPAGSH
jgi:Tol biopolymer transport system component